MKKIIKIVILIIGIYISLRLLSELSNIIIKIFNSYPEISVAFITGILAFISIPVGKYMENRYNTNINLKEKKSEVYLEFLNWLIDNILLRNVELDNNLMKEVKNQQKNLTIYASDKVLKSWMKFRKDIIKTEKIKKSLSKEKQKEYYIKNQSIYIEELILSIRKELGYKNKNFKKYDLLRMYILDLDKYI